MTPRNDATPATSRAEALAHYRARYHGLVALSDRIRAKGRDSEADSVLVAAAIVGGAWYAERDDPEPR